MDPYDSTSFVNAAYAAILDGQNPFRYGQKSFGWQKEVPA